MSCAVVAAAWCVLVAAQPSVPSGVLPQALGAHLRGERLQVVTSLRGLPLGVREALQGLFGSYSLDIAEPDTPIQTADARAAPTRPIRRLAVAGCSLDHCLVYYERLGVGHTWHLALFHWTPDATRLEGGGQAPGGLRSIDEVRTALLAGALKDAAKLW